MTAHSPHPPKGSAPAPARSRTRYRLAVASRTLAATAGGYALAASFATAGALLVRGPAEEAVMAAAVPSYLLFVGAVLWAFLASTATRAWLGVALPTLAALTLTWWLTRGAAA